MESIKNYFTQWFDNIADHISAANWAKVQVHLQTRIFGQHIAIQEAYTCIYEHLFLNAPRKALVIICNGSVGTGKTYFGKTIATHGFPNGFDNPAVKLINGPLDFPDSNQVNAYKERLRLLIETTVEKHRRCFFMFDEVDKMPIGVLDVLTPYVDTYEELGGVDYRKCVFMFISNTGGKRIEEIVLQQYKTDPRRDHLSLLHFRTELEQIVLNETGGLQGSEIIRKKLIDHYLPFLPLEKYNVLQCLEAEYMRMESPSAHLQINLRKIADSFDYGPEENPIFAVDGAKNIDVKLSYELELLKRSLQ